MVLPLVLNEGKGDQARAEQHQAGRGQSQETTGDKVMIAHEHPPLPRGIERSSRCLAPFTRSTHKALVESDALFLLSPGRNAFFQRDQGTIRRLAAKTIDRV